MSHLQASAPVCSPLSLFRVLGGHPLCFRSLGGHLSSSPNDLLQKTSFRYLGKCDGNMNINNSHGFPANIHHRDLEGLFRLAWHGGNCSAEQ